MGYDQTLEVYLGENHTLPGTAAPFPSRSPQPVLIVSGLPRSGTSLMMAMLQAAGFSLLTDNVRQADVSNPKGYYEFEPVKTLKSGDHGWLDQATGKVVKIVSPLLHYLPSHYQYRVIFMRRKLMEVLASQSMMLASKPTMLATKNTLHTSARKTSAAHEDAILEKAFSEHLANVEHWLASQPNMKTYYASYNDLLVKPNQVLAGLTEFLGSPLPIHQMISAIDPQLYRSRVNGQD